MQKRLPGAIDSEVHDHNINLILFAADTLITHCGALRYGKADSINKVVEQNSFAELQNLMMQFMSPSDPLVLSRDISCTVRICGARAPTLLVLSVSPHGAWVPLLIEANTARSEAPSKPWITKAKAAVEGNLEGGFEHQIKGEQREEKAWQGQADYVAVCCFCKV